MTPDRLIAEFHRRVTAARHDGRCREAWPTAPEMWCDWCLMELIQPAPGEPTPWDVHGYATPPDDLTPPALLGRSPQEEDKARELRWLAQVIGAGRFLEIQRIDGDDSYVHLEPSRRKRIARLLNECAHDDPPAGDSGGRLRALVAFTESVMITFRNYYAQAISRDAVEQKMDEWRKLKAELDALRAAPVVSPPQEPVK